MKVPQLSSRVVLCCTLWGGRRVETALAPGEVLKSAVQKAKLGQSEELAAIKRLDEQARRLERHASGPSVEALFAEERARSHQYGGRSVFGAEPPPSESSGRIRSGERSP
jgi:hypothetical protein